MSIDERMKALEKTVGATKPVEPVMRPPGLLPKLERQAIGRRLVQEWEAERAQKLEEDGIIIREGA